MTSLAQILDDARRTRTAVAQEQREKAQAAKDAFVTSGQYPEGFDPEQESPFLGMLMVRDPADGKTFAAHILEDDRFDKGALLRHFCQQEMKADGATPERRAALQEILDAANKWTAEQRGDQWAPNRDY